MKMFSILNPLTKYLKLKSVKIYGLVFVLHSKLTVSVLLACSLLISAKQFFGDPIQCISDEKNGDFLNSICWTMGTFIMDDFASREDREMPGVGITGGNDWDAQRIYLRYYQWVVLILLLQALSFFVPAFVWKVWEGGRLEQLCSELGSVVVSDLWEEKKKKMLVSYFSTDFSDLHMCYALKYFFCEFLNFIICILNILMMNVVFSGFWINYAPAMAAIPSNNWEKWNEHSSKIFPKISKCEFFKKGASGSTTKIDALCLLPLNILNEKLFAFLWCWFLILVVLSGLNIIYILVVMTNRNFRLQLLRAKIRFMGLAHISKVMREANVGDWFVLYKVSNNINPVVFRDLMHELFEVRKKSSVII